MYARDHHLAFFDGRCFLSVSRQHEVDVGIPCRPFISDGDDVAVVQVEAGLEQVQILFVAVALDAEQRPAPPCVVPCEVGVEPLPCCTFVVTSEQRRGCPPPPGGQVVLQADVVPRVVAGALPIPVEKLAVAEIEVGDKWFFCQIPFKGTPCRREVRHAEKFSIVRLVAHRVAHRLSVSRVSCSTRKPHFLPLQVGVLLVIGRCTLFAPRFKQHALVVCPPQSYTQVFAVEHGPSWQVARFPPLHVEAAINVERVAPHKVAVVQRMCQ